ncbi:hypothetical protein KIL84_012672 [Mauremys mutica]|uniref:Uncharacterized protein n=1 Tax=Mauremys mutica TaxID=74926 RepID=A0A9D3XSH8_9SAUR|nr:hypothetical protein KIL84_012672 [Mauremys mutica]
MAREDQGLNPEEVRKLLRTASTVPGCDMGIALWMQATRRWQSLFTLVRSLAQGEALQEVSRQYTAGSLAPEEAPNVFVERMVLAGLLTGWYLARAQRGVIPRTLSEIEAYCSNVAQRCSDGCGSVEAGRAPRHITP